jgi:transposase InsO family protein
LLDEGFEVRFKSGESRLLDSRGDLVCMIIPEGQIFKADVSRSLGPARCLMAGPSCDLWKWHRRLGHLSFDLVSHLSGLDLVRGLPKLKFEKDLVCAPCRHGKTPHPPLTDVMTERPTELLHIWTLLGQLEFARWVGSGMSLLWWTITRYAWVFFMEDKSETFGFVRDLIVRLRYKRYGNAIRSIRSDNGTKFKNSRFDAFSHGLGLEHQYSTPYVPPQNGVVERKNRTICEMARTMLDEHRTPMRYWAEAVNTACHVSNRILLQAFKRKTCYELMHGQAPQGESFPSLWLQVLYY